ncbi:HAUS5 protein, partial [Eolophus roseicapillus]|nr:HAUS5 protein [Eolophus roseicapilla]
RLCMGSCAPIWEFIIRHVRHPRNVKKIKGNLLWYPLHPKMGGTPKNGPSGDPQPQRGTSGDPKTPQDAPKPLCLLP